MNNFIFLPHYYMTRAFQSAMSKGRSLREVKTVTIQAIKKTQVKAALGYNMMFKIII